MGWNAYSLSEVKYVEVVSHKKRISGKCPMCEKEFDLEFDLKDGEVDYKCVCGYFRFDAESESFTEDNHNIPKEEWVQRRQEAEAKLAAQETEKEEEIHISFDTDLEDLLETIRCRFPCIPADQIGIYPDYDRDPGCMDVEAKLTIYVKKS